jgi:DNA-binding NtrC family response regulator
VSSFGLSTEALDGGELAIEGCVLYVAEGPASCAGRSLRLLEGCAVVGASSECDFVLDEPSVSRRHVEITVRPDGIEIRDLESTNGTFYLGQRLSLARLSPGSRFFIGRCGIDILPLGLSFRAIPPAAEERYGELVGKSHAMRRLFTLLRRLEQSEAPILILGETGTGKELVARAIHDKSARSGKPYVVIDCGNVQQDLVRSEIFGFKKGAFTGADEDRMGAFESAAGGTVFLDEIGELPLALQPSLLRVLETKQIQRIGETTPRPVDVRILAATHRDLKQEARAGRFREDLFYRLAVVDLTIPPLRDRADDIPLLAQHLASQLSGYRRPELPELLIQRALSSDWPGNVRELRNVIHRWLALGILELGGEIVELDPGAEAAPPEGIAPFKLAREQALAEFEKDYLVRLWSECGGNLSKAARVAGIDRKYLRELLRRHEVVAGPEQDEA